MTCQPRLANAVIELGSLLFTGLKEVDQLLVRRPSGNSLENFEEKHGEEGACRVGLKEAEA